jgi:predicted dehydrogenase
MDVDETEARRAAEETGAERVSTSFCDALANDIDAVVISTPNHLHCEQAVAALQAGKHVLLQKPMARTVAECDDILTAAASSGKTLGIYMNLLDHPLFRDLRRMIQVGYLGRIALVSARLAHRDGLSWQGGEANWRSSAGKTGGGSFMQLAVHYEHLIQWLLGDRVARVQAFSKNLACPQLEGDDLTLAHLELADGAYADLQTSWCAQEEHFSVMGTGGSIHYRDNRWLEFSGEGGPFEGQRLRLVGDGSREVVDPLLAPEWDDAANPFNQHASFFAALRAGSPPEVPGAEGREGVRVTQACYESARTERVIRL